MKAVDGLLLPDPIRKVLRPGELVSDPLGQEHRLPRFFYAFANDSPPLSEHFSVAELTTVDCLEAGAIRQASPWLVPCAVVILARYLEEFRARVNAPVFISANGGYRSPAHRRISHGANIHCWGTAADIYRIGDVWLDSPKIIERFARVAEAIGPEIFVPSAGFDHLHLDLGYLTLIPRGCCESLAHDRPSKCASPSQSGLPG